MAEQVRSTFEKYQFWAFTAMAGILFSFMMNAQSEMKRETADTRKEIVSLSHQVAIMSTKLDNYELAQKSMQNEIREINSRLTTIEMKMVKFENERR